MIIDSSYTATLAVKPDSDFHHQKRLRVLVYTTLFPNSVQPLMGNFVLEGMRFLLKFVDMSVTAPVPYFPNWIRFNSRWQNWAQVPGKEQFGGFEVQHPRYVVFPKLGMATHGVSMFAGTLQQVRRRLESADYDLIAAQYVYPDGFAAALLASVLNKPLVVSALGSDINLFSQFTVIRPLIRHVLRRSDGLIAVSHSLKERMVKLGCPAGNVAVIHNGVDPQKFIPRPQLEMRQQLGLPEDRPIVMAVGTLNDNKGFHILIEAVSRLRSSGVMLLIAGEGPRRGNLERQIRESRLTDNVRLIGAVPHGELSTWYNAADVFCLASSREGCPNVVLEAMACGRPVVATRVGGLQELVVSSEIGTLVDRSPEAFETALRDAFNRQWDHNSIVAHARTHSWNNVSIQVMDVYSRAIAHFHKKEPYC
jgi:glycosyltransferase involved in cell wall biosynthesis